VLPFAEISYSLSRWHDGQAINLDVGIFLNSDSEFSAVVASQHHVVARYKGVRSYSIREVNR
jgi:hypothetical protein